VQNNHLTIIEEYGVKLKPLTTNDLELIRRWRNDQKIARFMEFRDYITKDMQIKWFEKISNRHNYYYLTEFEKKILHWLTLRMLILNIKQEREDYSSGMIIILIQ